MPTISRDQVVRALAQSLRAAFVDGHSADVPGLGQFRIEHEKSRLLEDESGNMVLTPPRDTIVFEFEAEK